MGINTESPYNLLLELGLDGMGVRKAHPSSPTFI